MKIAVTYDNGQVFQHFGKTEAFMVYEIEDGNLVNSGSFLPMARDMVPWQDFWRSMPLMC